MSTTHVHLLLNHFPTVGFVMAIGLFVAAVIARSDLLKQVSLVAFVGIALVAIPTYVTGKPPPRSCAWRRQMNRAPTLRSHDR